MRFYIGEFYGKMSSTILIIAGILEEGLETSEAPGHVACAVYLQNSPTCYKNPYVALLLSPCVLQALPISTSTNYLSHKYYTKALPKSQLLGPKTLQTTLISEFSYLRLSREGKEIIS